MIKIIVLSLLDSDRREIISDRLKSNGFNDFEFFDAFDARQINIDELKNIFNIDKFTSEYRRRPAKGEIGCTISHIAIWNYIIEKKYDRVLVVEDDAFFCDRIKNFDFNLLPTGISILGYSKTTSFTYKLTQFKYPLKNKIKIAEHVLGDLDLEFMCGTVGYTIDFASAAKLVNSYNELPFFLADDFSLYKQYVKIFHLRPAMVFEDFKNIESNIQNERNHERTIIQKIKERIKMAL